MEDELITTEYLGNNISAFVSKSHKFGTDAVLLSSFTSIRKNDKVCDLGTGCGIIPLLWTSRGFTNEITAVEIQKSACELLEKSIEFNKLSNIEVYNHDLKKIDEVLKHASFDIVTMNPPYFADNSGFKNPDESALIARHEIACNIGDISKTASFLLKHSGRFYICHRPERLCDVIETLRKHKLEPKKLRFIVQKSNLSPWLFLMEAIKGGKSGLKIENQLVVQNQDDSYTDEFRSLYGDFATF